MADINFRSLKPGQEIKVVTAWGENETLDEISGHFFTGIIDDVYFEVKGELAYLRIFTKDANGQRQRVNWMIENGEIKNTGVVVKIATFQNKVVEFPKPLKSDYICQLCYLPSESGNEHLACHQAEQAWFDTREIAKTLVKQERMAA